MRARHDAAKTIEVGMVEPEAQRLAVSGPCAAFRCTRPSRRQFVTLDHVPVTVVSNGPSDPDGRISISIRSESSFSVKYSRSVHDDAVRSRLLELQHPGPVSLGIRPLE